MKVWPNWYWLLDHIREGNTRKWYGRNPKAMTYLDRSHWRRQRPETWPWDIHQSSDERWRFLSYSALLVAQCGELLTHIATRLGGDVHNWFFDQHDCWFSGTVNLSNSRVDVLVVKVKVIWRWKEHWWSRAVPKRQSLPMTHQLFNYSVSQTRGKWGVLGQ